MTIVGTVVIKKGKSTMREFKPHSCQFFYLSLPLSLVNELSTAKAINRVLGTMKPPIFTPLITHDQLQGRLKMLNPWS